MMHRELLVWSAACFTLVIPMHVCLSAEAPAEARSQALQREVKALEQRWLENEDRVDVVQTILADDFVHVLPIGFIGKEEHLNYLRKHPGVFRGSKRFQQLKVRIYGQVAIAIGVVSNTRENTGIPVRFMFTDVFVRRAGRWLAVNAQELPLESAPKAGP
ncbi:MAG TPA: nuclear transport factor 2 family protein [Steroidobacteraceae bacterium]